MTASRAAWGIGGVGLLLSLLGAIIQPDAFAFAWLAALTTWLRWPLGCLALLLIHALTGGRWGFAIRPYLTAGIAMLPLLPLAIVPLLFMLPHLYPWLRHDVSAQLDNRFYLNGPFAIARWLVYLNLWLGLGAWSLWRVRRDRPVGALAAPGLILLGLTVNFAAIDAVMSLEPHFNSSDFGMTFAAETGLFALSVTILATLLSGPVAPEERNDLGRLLQSLLILWAYLDFMQLLIVWQSDLPHEAAWYIARSDGLWGGVATTIAVAHFLLPFLALLAPPMRRSARWMIVITSLLIVMSVVRGWWLVLPAQRRGIGWIDIGAVLAFAGVSIGLLLRTPRPRLQPGQLTHA